MARYTPPCSFQETVARVIKAAGGVEAAANELMTSITTVSNGTEMNELRPGGFGGNYLARLARWRPACALPLAEFFAAHAGGVFQPINLDGASGENIHRIMKEFSDVLARHAEAHSSESIDPQDYTVNEAAAQIREVDEVMAELAAFRSRLLDKVEAK
jgi:hypothetical protein